MIVKTQFSYMYTRVFHWLGPRAGWVIESTCQCRCLSPFLLNIDYAQTNSSVFHYLMGSIIFCKFLISKGIKIAWLVPKLQLFYGKSVLVLKIWFLFLYLAVAVVDCDMWQVTGDMWLIKHETWHVPLDTWHVAHEFF